MIEKWKDIPKTAYVNVNGKTKSLGTYDTPEGARQARCDFKHGCGKLLAQLD